MTFIEVTVSDDAADKIASDLQALDLHAEAACIQVLLRDRDRLRQTLRAVNDNALAWHAGEDGKAKALGVIAVWASEALAGRLHHSVELIEANRGS